jgi:phage tail-like protein
MAKIENPRKVFNFSIQIVQAPLNNWLAQDVEIPEESIEVTEHGDTNHNIKTGGRHMFGMAKITKLMLASGSDTYFFDWMASVADVQLGGGLIPTQYKRTLIVNELAEDGGTIINTWTMTGCWPSKRSAISLQRMSSDNTMEEIELCVDKVEKL